MSNTDTSQKKIPRMIGKFAEKSSYTFIKKYTVSSSRASDLHLMDVPLEDKLVLDRIDSNIEKVTTYKNTNDYLKHLDDFFNE